MKAIGIDLGTTNSAVAVYDPARKSASVLPNLAADRLTPSVVGPAGKDGLHEVGARALRLALKDPVNTIVSIKRLMGLDYGDPAVTEACYRLSYQVVPGPGKDPQAHVMIRDDRLSPAEVSAIILDKLKRDAGVRLGATPTQAVITVPAYFTERQRAATREAGELAGLAVKRIIDEPTAAAIAFGVALPAGDQRRILVYDLGGGTFDISILNAVKSADGPSLLHVLAFTGDSWLGGDDFDLLIVERIIAWVKENFGQDPTHNAMFRFLAKEHAERAKRELSESEDAYIYFGGLRGEDGIMLDVEMELTRPDFDAMVAPLVKKTIDLVRSTLDEAKVSRDDISDVLLVGGSTLTPAVYEAVEKFFGSGKVRRHVDPLECVAIGAGIIAGTLPGVECPNPACRTVNDEDRSYCQACGHSLAAARSTGTAEIHNVADGLHPDGIENRADFCAALNAVRERSGLSPRDVAIRIGMPVTTVRGYFEHSRLPAEHDVLYGILTACGVHPEALAGWDDALSRVRAQRSSAAGKARHWSGNQSGTRGSDPPGREASGSRGEETDLLFRVYIPNNQLYADQRRKMLDLFREWLVNFQGQQIRQEDISGRDGHTVAFFAGPGQPRPLLSERYRDFVSFVEMCAHSPTMAIGHLAASDISESIGVELVKKYAREYHRLELDARQAREARIMTLQHTFEAELLEKDMDPQTIAGLRLRSALEQIVPPPSAMPLLPAIASPAGDVPPSQTNITFNAQQLIVTAIDRIQGTANFTPQAKELLDLVNKYGGEQAGPLRTALHEVEDPGVPSRLRSEATRKLKSFLADLARQLPGVGVDLLQKYLEQQLGLPGS